MRHRRWSRLLISLGIVGLALCAGATQAAVRSSEASSFGLKIAQSSIVVQLDPNMDTVGDAYWYYMNVFDGLTFIDYQKGKPVLKPALATKWTQRSANVWRFQLRPGVRFSNGQPFTATDVKFSIDRILDPATRSPLAARISTIDQVFVRNARTVDIKTKAPDLLLPGRLSIIFMEPQAYFQRVGAAGFAAEPVGTGPYKVTSFTRTSSMTLARNASSWRKANASTVQLIQIPEASSRVSALRAGDVDIIQNVPNDQLSALRSSGYAVNSALQGRTFQVNLNAQNGGPLADVRVRRALNYAIDKRAIVRSLLAGIGQTAQGQPIGPNGVGFNPKVKAFPYDQERAKQLLSQAGYPNGFAIRMDASNGFYPNDLAVEQVIVQQLRDVGVRVSMNVLGASAYVAAIFAGRMDQMVFHGVNYFPVMDADFYFSNFTCAAVTKWQCDKTLDSMFNTTRTAPTQKTREASLLRLSQWSNENPIAIYLYQIPSLVGMQRGIKGVQVRPDLVVVFDRITK